MTKRMLIDASHAEETRVVVLDGQRLEEFDLEAANRLPLKGNIYLAKVVRVEPSLQAAFVEYGGNRHGFLAFGEIHPDYYQIPVADRQRLIAMQEAEAREEDEAEERAAAREAGRREAAPLARRGDRIAGGAAASEEVAVAARDDAAAESEDEAAVEATVAEVPEPADAAPEPYAAPAEAVGEAEGTALTPEAASVDAVPATPEATEYGAPATGEVATAASDTAASDAGGEAPPYANGHDPEPGDAEEEAPPPETLGGEGPEEAGRERRAASRHLRHYKIQEVIRRRQIMLVQVVKEERGNKGAALTTYVSLAGRFSVLMPNSPRGGGVSRKITSAGDRKRLREVIDELDMPKGMSLIVRTAGAQRPKPEIRRDCEYLLRLWDSIRERTLASSAPALIYEEADLIKRSIRDVFSRDVEEIVVDGEPAYQEAREFMRMLMPQNLRKISLARDGGLFARSGVEAQLDAMHSPAVPLRSGGSIVINQTEALVAIDVNSGRSTRERHIEDTALRTNLEAADEIARQLRLRDLAGLIVIDFIDMESSRHDAQVERRVKDALRFDRARIQVGRISHFGLLEMSRQRLRPSLAEQTFVSCPTCGGRGHVRSIESSAIQVLRAIEEEAAKRRAAEIVVHVAAPVALYLLNRKRDRLAQIEAHFGLCVLFEPDDSLHPPAHRIDRTRAAEPDRRPEAPAALRMDYAPEPERPAAGYEEADDTEEDEAEVEASPASEPGPARPDGEASVDGDGRRRRRRRRRGGRREDAVSPEGEAVEAGAEALDAVEADAAETEAAAEAAPASEPGPARPDGEATVEAEAGTVEGRSRRRRGRRGGSRRRLEGEGAPAEAGEEDAAEAAPMAAPLADVPRPHDASRPPTMPRYAGPTPADPFAGQVDDIYAAMAAAEAAAEAAATAGRAIPIPVLAGPAPMPELPVGSAAAEPHVEPAPDPVAAPDSALSEPEAPPPAPPEEPRRAPPVQPILLGATTEAPKRAGWWRR